MPYSIERLSIIFKCTQCGMYEIYRDNSLSGVIEKAKKNGWEFPWKLEDIKPIIYDSDEECICPTCSTREKRQFTDSVTDCKYIIYYPPGSRSVDGIERSNTEHARWLLDLVTNKGKHIIIPWIDMVGWKIMYHQSNGDWIELTPKSGD